MKKLFLLITLVVLSSLIFKAANYPVFQKPALAQDDGSGGGDSGGGDTGGGDGSGGDTGSGGGGEPASDTPGGTDDSSAPAESSGAPAGEGGDPTSQGGTWSPDGMGGQEFSAPGQEGVVGTTADGVTYSTGSYALDQAVAVDQSAVPSGVPEGAAFWSGDGWSVGVSGGGEVSAPAETGAVVGVDPGSDNSGNSGGGGDNPPPDTGPLPCTTNCSPAPPAAFAQRLPVSFSCRSTNGNPVIRASWNSSSNFTNYYIYYVDAIDNVARGGWDVGSREYFDFTSSSSLIPGHRYGFIVRAVNSSGYQTYSDGGLWSHELFGFTTFPDCTPPGAFSQSNPQGVCLSLDNPQINLSWGSSAGAANYKVMYRDRTSGTDVTERIYSDRGLNRDEAVRGLSAGHSYGFLIVAQNTAADSYSNDAWSDSISGYGPTIFPDCSPPQINLKLTGITKDGTKEIFSPNGVPLPVRQNDPVTLSWTTNNVPPGPPMPCTGSIPATLLDSGKPTPANILNLWNTGQNNSGSILLPQLVTTGIYNFTLTCTSLWNIQNSSFLQLRVDQLQKPYIQTTGGDVHTNESINISQ